MVTRSQTLALAVQHHQGDRLETAEQIYRQVLQAEPNNAEALHLLGVIAHQRGKHEEAVETIGRALGLRGNAASFHCNLGVVYHALRRFPEAVACYRRALELKPDYAEAAYNLGNALKDQGKLDETVACYRRTLGLKPDYAEALNNLGATLCRQGKLAQAVASFRRAVELKPDYAEAHNNLGIALKDQGKPAEAPACYRRALELKPDYAEAHNNLGMALQVQGKLEEAVACCRRALELEPDYAEAHNSLGIALKEQGKPAQAVACYRRALQLKPDYAEAHINLGIALKEQGKSNEAVACFQRALELKPDYVEAHYNLGIALNNQGKLEEALACYRRALELKPDDAGAHCNLGCVLEEKGDFHGAEEFFRAALRHDSRFAMAHYKLAELLRGKLPQQDLAALGRLLQQGSASAEQRDLTDAERLLLHFGLAQVLDARGEYAEAARHLERGNALQLSEWRTHGREYDPQAHEVSVTRMIALCEPDFFQRVGGFGLENELPLFVVGLPRSGTTLIEQILAGHSRVFGAGETGLAPETMAALGGPGVDSLEGLRGLDCQTAQRLASRHLEKLRGLAPAALRIVDKMPENYLFLGLLAALFPRAKLIHCRRDLRDVAVSCWMTNFQDLRWTNDQAHIASRFHQYRRIMEHWRKVLPVPLLEVDYEETVADLETVARRLVAWCGLEWEPACLEFHRGKRAVRTASAVQVRQPLYSTSVGRWRHYEQALAALLGAIPGGK